MQSRLVRLIILPGLAACFNPRAFERTKIDSPSDFHESAYATPANAYTRERVRERHARHLYNRWRFTSNDNSYASSGDVGLGGGVEIAFDIRFCKKMAPRVEFWEGCDHMRRAVRRAARYWSDYHPVLFFPVYTKNTSYAEVVMHAEEKAGDALAWANPTEILGNGFPVRGTNGARAVVLCARACGWVVCACAHMCGVYIACMACTEAGQDMPAARRAIFQITFNTRHCWTFLLTLSSNADHQGFAEGHPCAFARTWSFEEVLAHELGHVLGLGHPGENGKFLDSSGFHNVFKVIPIVSACACACMYG